MKKMKKKRWTAALLLAFAMTLAACSGGTQGETAVETTAESTTAAETTEAAAAADNRSPEEKAQEAAALIDKIYVQNWTESTEEDCRAAKAAWDSLTDEEKEFVEGKFADPDYFGRDTGDSAKDDPRNQDGIGDNEILVVSFGTSFNDSRSTDIKGIEDAIQAAYPSWSVRRAFTSQIIINHILARDGEQIDNVAQALERAVENGVKNLIVQPTHLMHGAEYDELLDTVDAYRDKFDMAAVAEPLLGEVGADATVVNADKEAVAKLVTEEALKSHGMASMEEAKEAGTAFVLMGHGTSHTAKVSYSQMQTMMAQLGYDNVFIGTVEGEPEETACEAVIEAAAEAGYENIVLRPLMVVAGDHANNDMAGEDEDSWLSMFTASGKFRRIDTEIEGLGRIPGVQDLYIRHIAAAIRESALPMEALVSVGDGTAQSMALSDGEYEAKFQTDSSMFHVNEALDGKGTLYVSKGEMVLHVSLTSKNIVHLYPGTAMEAEQEDADILIPTVDTVTYQDGSTEEVHGFDIPVPYLDREFDLALVGTKGVWYDHKVSVSLVK